MTDDRERGKLIRVLGDIARVVATAVLPLALFVLSLLVPPRSREMFAEMEVVLPPITELALWPGLPWLLLALALVFIGLFVGVPRARKIIPVVSFLFTVGAVIFFVIALFLPLQVIVERISR